jgi:hypothetical protein
MSKLHFATAFGLALLLSACQTTQTAQVSPEDLVNMQRLVGSWRVEVTGEGKFASHREFALQGNEIAVTYVNDVDWVAASQLKGDRSYWGKFHLNGRRLNGSTRVGSQAVPITGIVDESFRRIEWRHPLPGISGGSGVPSYSDQLLLKE